MLLNVIAAFLLNLWYMGASYVKSVTRLLLDIVGVAENNGLKLPREFGMLIK